MGTPGKRYGFAFDFVSLIKEAAVLLMDRLQRMHRAETFNHLSEIFWEKYGGIG